MNIPGYNILKPIGIGGMATAYLAVQTSLQRQVVLKVLHSTEATTEESVERFIKEGRILASLNHPNIITIHDIGMADKLVYLSMEFVEGGDLKERISKGALPPAEALSIVKGIAAGLYAAHKNGVIHRDVKPANILFHKDGTPLLTDFGIAKKMTANVDELTRTGTFLGSPNYMAPEQAEAGPIDGRADIYALGVIFYEMLTGRKPYQSPSVINVIVQHKQAPIPKLPPALQGYQPLLDLMMAKDRRDRFRDAESLLHFIDKFEHDLRTPAGAEPAPGRAIGRARSYSPGQGVTGRWRISVFLTIGFILSSLAYGIVFYYAQTLKIVHDSGDQQPPKSVMQQDELANAAVIPKPAIQSQILPPVDVRTALIWLAEKSLEEYRLTSPPQNNAYYYYSRLLQMEPDSEQAKAGFQKIAARFALLAEREIARGHDDEAQRYLHIGLQLDPQNPQLRQLGALSTTPARKGLWQSITKYFQNSQAAAEKK
ncbi:MAG TPA: serine/threonine-protein kinase [Gammaproteobacteria bacterium]|nr:serine/threonine-protein kinase [Gammaproteobacteria bacterium]